jgi:hypothetical protein
MNASGGATPWRSCLTLHRIGSPDDVRVLYRFKRAFRDGTTHVVLSPTEFIERLAAQVPPPRRHMVTYHGVLAPAAGYRDQVVPVRESRPCAIGPRAA